VKTVPDLIESESENNSVANGLEETFERYVILLPLTLKIIFVAKRGFGG